MIREDAARKLARRLLEVRVSGMTPLDDRFIDVVARVIMTYVQMDEQAQSTEAKNDKTGE